MIDSAEDREYEEMFCAEFEPVPRGWVERLSRFKTGPEIQLIWDDDE